MEYYSAIKKKSFESVPMRWMKLEPIIQSKVSQKDVTSNKPAPGQLDLLHQPFCVKHGGTEFVGRGLDN